GGDGRARRITSIINGLVTAADIPALRPFAVVEVGAADLGEVEDPDIAVIGRCAGPRIDRADAVRIGTNRRLQTLEIDDHAGHRRNADPGPSSNVWSGGNIAGADGGIPIADRVGGIRITDL